VRGDIGLLEEFSNVGGPSRSGDVAVTGAWERATFIEGAGVAAGGDPRRAAGSPWHRSAQGRSREGRLMADVAYSERSPGT
jgi:hypothetical protein